MLPSLAGRLVALFGILCGCTAAYLAEWGQIGASELFWKALAGLAVLCLVVSRRMPRTVVDAAALRARAGDAAVNRLGRVRVAGIVATIPAILTVAFVAPVVHGQEARHAILLVCAGVFAGAMALLFFVEARFRTLIERAGIPLEAPQ